MSWLDIFKRRPKARPERSESEWERDVKDGMAADFRTSQRRAMRELRPSSPTPTAATKADEPLWKQIRADFDGMTNTKPPFGFNAEAKFWPEISDKHVTEEVVNALATAGIPYEDKSNDRGA